MSTVGLLGERVRVRRTFVTRFAGHRLAVVSLALLVALCVACFGAGLWAPYSPTAQNLGLGAVGPSWHHWFGTDLLGRDQFTRILYAGRVSLAIGLAVALLSTLVGTAVGAVAGAYGAVADQALMRLTDLFLVVPPLAILAIALQRFGDGDAAIVLVLAGLFWMYVARVVRAEVLAVKEREFVEAARAIGASRARVVVRHVLPNVAGPIVVNATLAVAAAILAESTLSFLGFGVQPPNTSWGAMVSDAVVYRGGPHAYLLYFPGLAILVTVLAVNFVGDGVRDALDPRRRADAR